MIYNELGRTDIVLIKYMDQVKLYENDFRILDRYKGFLEMVEACELSLKDAVKMLHVIFKEEELAIFDEDANYIIYKLRQNVINEYIKHKDKK